MFMRLLALLLLLVSLPAVTVANLVIDWKELSPVPDELGLGGPQAGVHNGALIVVGGANFPQGPPWEGGPKTWHGKIHVLPHYKQEGAVWRDGGSLSMLLGHGTSHSTKEGVIIVGGGDAGAHTNKVHRLRWTGQAVVVEELSPLPFPLAFHASVMIGDVIYVTGGTSAPTDTQARNDFLRLDLSEENATWRILAPLPGDGRIMPVIAAVDGKVFVAGGASLSANDEGRAVREYLRTGFKYDPKVKEGEKWKPIADMPRGAVAAPTPSPRVGPSHFIVLGRDTGENLPPNVALQDHPGFEREILAYHTITNTWAVMGELPFAHVTGPLIEDGGSFIIPTGEIRPGVRSPRVYVGQVKPTRAAFGIVNWVVLVGYLIGVTVVGLIVTGVNKNTNEFFRGGGKIPWWAVGLSIFATMASSIGYLAIPAKAYSEDWVFIMTSVPIVLLAPIVIRYYLPFFRRVDSSSAYEFLERRFSVLIRLFGSFSFLLFHLGRMAVVLYLPALAIATVTSFDEILCILLMGLLCIIYCTTGGMFAVVLTDVVQTIVLLGALLMCVVFVFFSIDGGVGAFFSTAITDKKFHAVEWGLSPLMPVLWVVLVGNLFSNLLPYTADQGVVQRYMTTKDEKAAAGSIWTNAALVIPNTLLMFFLGTALYVFYKSFPERLSPTINTDAIFPLFIANELPIGLAGLAVAGILAAAQSTLTTSINSISTVVVVDVVGRFKLTKKGAEDLRLARILSVAAGLVGTGLAIWISQLETRSLWDFYMKIMGLTGSSLSGLFILGMFTKRATAAGAAIGVLVSIVSLWYVQTHTQIHFFLWAMVGVGVTVIVGYAVSLATLPKSDEELKGLTLHTIEK